jgi:DNA-directed RNA polymerase subunit RPC12/RpoP
MNQVKPRRFWRIRTKLIIWTRPLHQLFCRHEHEQVSTRVYGREVGHALCRKCRHSVFFKPRAPDPDAARFRWLRDHAHWGIKHRLQWYMPYNEWSLEANIDAEMRAHHERV